ncbi:hypothetical protein EMIHUDRAFT_200360 [Emiliania huxleyi CCMP1516]|uniref:Right handed beta helix domain-containing protein n=2 Tax=Emiliania huxleyi TaxID=2903 RepID=A0A0D3KQF5_EMIH1|nr:hypothetical protein EMIHUDRAFT_200360 [Emiliania huxleyi CCMP1516]EOD37990.1 hypothetical protein EMIHUDRAFT_200360 [Emiliania huxleyi CCMP1516]|eukprot:XP_005790419.1 hypothetical protein EMIHUDRAFT_200360 [Emiliania huxleyi CCMP1516]
MICILATAVNSTAASRVGPSQPPVFCVHAGLGGRRAVVGSADASRVPTRESVTEPPDAATISRETLEATVRDGSDAVKHIDLERHSAEALSAPPDLTGRVGTTSPWGVQHEYNRGCVSTSAPTLLLLLLAACGSGLLLRLLTADGGLKWARRFGAIGLLGTCGACWLLLGQRAPRSGIRDEINKAMDQGRNASVFIPPGARLAFSSNVECSGDLHLNMHLSVRSSGEGATLDGKKSSNMFYISGGCSLYLEALHFVDGRSDDNGGAVRADGAGDIAMKDVSFTGCEASGSGGGMSVHSSGDVSLEGASFSECTAARYGGGMVVDNSGHVSLEGASFSECTARNPGGGMNVYKSGDVLLEGASFSECTAAQSGGGMNVQNSGDVSLERASFVGCTSETKAALYLNGVERLALTNSHFVDNIASQTPAALFFASGIAATDSILRNTTFFRNSAPGNITILAASPLTMEEAGSDAYCAPGFTGPECELCAAENHYLADGVECKECAPRGASAALIAGIVFVLCAACGLAAWAYSETGWRKKACIGPILRFADRAVYWYVGVGLTAKLKILFGFYQICTVLSSTYSARLPEEYTGWTDRLANAMSIDWSGVFLPEQCLGYGLRLLAIALSPVALIALLMGTGIALRLRRWRAAPPPRPTESSGSGPGADTGLVEASMFEASTTSVMSAVSAIAEAINTDESTVSASHARPWYAEAALGLLDLTPAGLVLIFCFAYTISPPNEPLEQVSYMRQDASVECGTEDHESITDLAIGFIVVWPVGSLVLFTSLLAACYKPLQAKTPNAMTRATAFLHREYEKTWYWWEAVELARKLVLTGFVLLIPEERAFLRLVVATLVCSCYAVALAVVRPYKRVGDDVLAVATSLVLLLLFLGANWTTIFLGIEERYPGTEEAAAILGFGKLNGVVNSMLVLVGVTLLFFLIGAVVAARRVAMIPTIRLASTKQPPEMSIVLGLTWHLFNSHIWSTGQDAVKVDDLKDIGALEEYIQRIFTLALPTSSCPAPQNCLREVRSSLEKDKPLVLVQEADPEKGGGTLQALRDECPEDLQPDIFDKDWPLTIWYRIDEFRLISLKIIAEAPRGPRATHMLLYLNQNTWLEEDGERLAEHVKQAREDKLKIVMAHENDPGLGGCQFSRMFEVTPQERARGELIAGGLYKDLAKSCFPGRHRKAPCSIAERGSLAGRSLGGLSRVFAKMSSRSSAEARDVSGGEASSVQRQEGIDAIRL